MTTWIIEPRDPLIVRDGRPFGLIPGARASTLAFPFPSTTTGALRTRAGQDSSGAFVADRIDSVQQIGVRGPLLVQLDPDGAVVDWFAPAPADALHAELTDPTADVLRRVPLVPLARPTGTQSNLPEGLHLVGPAHIDPRKPYAAPPRFWRGSLFGQWLLAPEEDAAEGLAVSDLGLAGLERNWRTHVRIDAGSQAALEGALFQTSGLEFTTKKGWRLALAVVAGSPIPAGIGPVGGESRLAAWRTSDWAPPACPAKIKEAVTRTGACRVVLLTPGCFDEGFRPGVAHLLRSAQGVTPKLVAAAVGRPDVVSGWDYVARRPKPTRRLAPAGSVYFLKLEGDQAGSKASASAIESWLDHVWMSNVSDEERGRLDGFGLAVVGAWSGQLGSMEVKV